MVKLHYFNQPINIGDQLAPVIIDWILKKNIIQDRSIGDINLLTIGSILAADFFYQDAVVWGTGIHYVEDAGRLGYDFHRRKLDVRAVRGPITRRALEQVGYLCPHIYGDPAILMPLIYTKRIVEKRKKASVIRQLQQGHLAVPKYVNKIDVETANYKQFIDEILASDRIISSSLHGIILGESYGIPSVFLLENETHEIIKYFDWYYSTGRKNIKIAHSIEEAMSLTPMKLPDISYMQSNLLKAFPYDIYQSEYSYQKKKEIVLFGMGRCYKDTINLIQSKVEVRYVCDNDSSKWGSCYNGLMCIPPEQLNRMKNVYVVITVENEKYSKQIEKQIEKQNILYHETVFQWIRHLNYGAFL